LASHISQHVVILKVQHHAVEDTDERGRKVSSFPIQDDAGGDDCDMIEDRKTAIDDARKCNKPGDKDNVASDEEIGKKGKIPRTFQKRPEGKRYNVDAGSKIDEMAEVYLIYLISILEEDKTSQQESNKNHPADHPQS
jgi:hypothetical protein